MKFEATQLSEKGKNWKGERLNEDTLPGNTKVMWRNNIYETGNRRHDEVELYKDGVFVRTVVTDYVYLVKGV